MLKLKIPLHNSAKLNFKSNQILLMQILNTTEILQAVQPQDEKLFLRWLEAKIDQIVKFPAIMPYQINARFGELKIDSAKEIYINEIPVRI